MAPQPPQLSRRVYAAIGLGLMATLWRFGPALEAQGTTAPGGFVESTTSTASRPRFSAAQIQGFLPSRGRFTFPAPYGTEGVRLTNASDCGGGDCVLSVGYSYWRNINNHAGSSTMLVALGLDRRYGGGGPTLFSYDKVTGLTQNLGPLFPANSNYSWASGEGWYFSATQPTILYMQDGARMLRYDVLSRALSTVFDATSHFGPNKKIWQTHTSQDDRVHSFTLKDGSTSAALGCGVFLEATGQFQFVPAKLAFDECQVDRSGRYLVVKDQIDGAQGEDNLILDLTTGSQQVLSDPQGAGGHSDSGFGYQVAEDNWHPKPSAVRIWNLGGNPGDGSQGRLVFHATDWAFGSNHIAHENSRSGVALDQQVACSSNVNRQQLPRANEVLCYRLDGSLQVLVVAPIMTDLNASGGGSDEYWKLPKGNLDVTGEYFIWASNMGGARQDAFIVRIPLGQLSMAPAPAPTPSPTPTPTQPAPAPAPDPTPAPAPIPTGATAVSWTSLVNAVVVGSELRKQSGCDGCPDSGAVSAQQLTGDGYVEFTATQTSTLRWLGLSQGNKGTSHNEIAFALRLGPGYAEVRERGAYRADTPVSLGDVLRVEVSGGQVVYRKNGGAFYTSSSAPSYPLLVDTSLHSSGSSFASVIIASMSSSGGSTSPTSPSPTTSDPAPGSVHWTDLRNVTVDGNTLRKIGGCFGCPDASAVSVETLNLGQSFEVHAGAGGLSMVGVTRTSSPAPKDFDFSLRFTSEGVEVRERGVYRGQTDYAVGDLFRIHLHNGQVTYAKNGVVFRTTTTKNVAPSRIGALLYVINGWVETPVIP